MTHYFYIIFSESLSRFYVGETHNINERISKHNNHTYKMAFTKAASDWVLKITKACKNKEEAIFLEKFTKRMKSKKFIQKIIDNPKLLDDLLENYK